MVQTPIKQLTLEEFLALPETKPASEYINGQVLQKPMPQGQHSRIQQKLLDAINAVAFDALCARYSHCAECIEAESIALALPELCCTFGGRSTVPDIAVFRWDRISTNADGTKRSGVASTRSVRPLRDREFFYNSSGLDD